MGKKEEKKKEELECKTQVRIYWKIIIFFRFLSHTDAVLYGN
jgi:hypothetical protein